MTASWLDMCSMRASHSTGTPPQVPKSDLLRAAQEEETESCEQYEAFVSKCKTQQGKAQRKEKSTPFPKVTLAIVSHTEETMLPLPMCLSRMATRKGIPPEAPNAVWISAENEKGDKKRKEKSIRRKCTSVGARGEKRATATTQKECKQRKKKKRTQEKKSGSVAIKKNHDPGQLAL